MGDEVADRDPPRMSFTEGSKGPSGGHSRPLRLENTCPAPVKRYGRAKNIMIPKKNKHFLMKTTLKNDQTSTSFMSGPLLCCRVRMMRPPPGAARSVTQS